MSDLVDHMRNLGLIFKKCLKTSGLMVDLRDRLKSTGLCKYSVSKKKIIIIIEKPHFIQDNKRVADLFKLRWKTQF